ncbi:hypothetical protein WMY93_009798 [Mugilogobius chulae]|uniref:Uncharacterized protein n=1 Tax=Mugilogobius chulae TaxID=88201 RepID=A0AAW0PDW9_9GOBI
MWDRIQALENHGKRNNVRVIGLKEALGADGTLLSCVQKMLAEGLGINAAAPEFEIERAHRALASLPDPDKPPRPVLVRFLRQSARDKVIAAAKVKGGFEWEKCRVSVFPDMTKELAEKRKAFTPVKRRLQQHNARYTLAFPATLKAVAMPHVIHDLRITKVPPRYSKAALHCLDSIRSFQLLQTPLRSFPTCACMLATSTDSGYKVN